MSKETLEKLRKKQIEQEYQARLEQHEKEMEALYNMFSIDSEEEIEVTVEDVEIELASIDTYRGYELDRTIDEVEWLNDNIKLSDILPQCKSEGNVVNELALLLNMSHSNVRLLLRRGLGIIRGTDYQNKQKEYLDCLIEDFKYGMYDSLLDYLETRRLHDFYKVLLEYIGNRISTEPLSNDENELTFYVIYDDLRKVMKYMNYTDGSSDTSIKDKLKILCDIKLLTNLESEELTPKALHVANNFRDNVAQTMSEEHGRRMTANRRNHYVLNDLSPQTQLRAMGIIVKEKECNLRQKNKNSTAITLVHGEHNGVVVQRGHNISETKLKNFVDAANILLEKQDYYTENQLRIQYMKKDRNIKKKDAIRLTGEYLGGVNTRVDTVRTRVNSETREYYSLPKSIKSNSIIYIRRE